MSGDMIDTMMEESAGVKLSNGRDCESSTVIRDKSVEYSDIKFQSCKRFFMIIVFLFIVGGIFLLLERFTNYAQQIVIKCYKGETLKQITMKQIEKNSRTKSTNPVWRKKVTK